MVELVETMGGVYRLNDIIGKFPDHIYQQPHVYSIEDFIHVKNGDLLPQIMSVFAVARTHVVSCEVSTHAALRLSLPIASLEMTRWSAFHFAN